MAITITIPTQNPALKIPTARSQLFNKSVVAVDNVMMLNLFIIVYLEY